jgi:hypothetical protein
MDPRTYIYTVYNIFADVPNGSLTNMGSIILTTMGILTCKNRRDRKNERLPAEFHNSEFADLTDYQNPEFRYAL